MAMLRITSSKIVPNAVRAISSGRALCGSITNAFYGCDQDHTVPFVISHHFSTDAKKQTDRKLLKLLKSELKLKHIVLERGMPKTPSDFPFIVKEDTIDIILTRDFEGEKIDVIVARLFIPNDVDDDVSSGDDDDDNDDTSSSDERSEEDEEEKEPLSLTVTISKENGKFSEYEVYASANEFKIRSFLLKEPAAESSHTLLSYGPHDVEEEGDMQNALGEYLKIRGIKKSYYRFLYKCMVKKYRKDHVVAMKKLKEFLAE